MLVIIGCLQFPNLLLEQQNLAGVILLKSLNLDLFLSSPLLARIIQLPLHIMSVPGHQTLQLIPLLLRSESRDVLRSGQLIALDGQKIDLLDFVLEHVLQLLDVPLVELVALQSLLLQ